jgi:hypothetical protein
MKYISRCKPTACLPDPPITAPGIRIANSHTHAHAWVVYISAYTMRHIKWNTRKNYFLMYWRSKGCLGITGFLRLTCVARETDLLTRAHCCRINSWHCVIHKWENINARTLSQTAFTLKTREPRHLSTRRTWSTPRARPITRRTRISYPIRESSRRSVGHKQSKRNVTWTDSRREQAVWDTEGTPVPNIYWHLFALGLKCIYVTNDISI